MVFARPDGRPIPSRDDWEEWKQLAREAGIRESRTHDARHTAATLMLEHRMDIRVGEALWGGQ